MVVGIRLSRFGCRNKPFYRVMAADSRSPRDGKHLEVLVIGWGAQPSESVQCILFRAGPLPPLPMLAVMSRKRRPRGTRPIDPLSGRYLSPATPLTNKKAATLEKAEQVTGKAFEGHQSNCCCLK